MLFISHALLMFALHPLAILFHLSLLFHHSQTFFRLTTFNYFIIKNSFEWKPSQNYQFALGLFNFLVVFLDDALKFFPFALLLFLKICSCVRILCVRSVLEKKDGIQGKEMGGVEWEGIRKQVQGQ